ncbi:abortive infection family protein [Falsochrobactrum ovis]|uniref:Abortive infection Abi-like protein n=1 Tax=Falsochrobactrum ovis TaxID=1293442 RepID=A0A364JWA4_9HYPH|nr:abortive infection family protein [Falsochrobactrum ovis]RAK30119.1 abortive infection Abi-like protein [Falsochrobactrum ovis]
MKEIPNSVIGTVSSVLGNYYYSHSKLNSLFMESGAPGDVPEGNCETKCSRWLKRCNNDPSIIDPLTILGRIIQPFMDDEHPNERRQRGQERIRSALAKNQLAYHLNGVITHAGTTPAAETLADFFKKGDFVSIRAEFARAISNVESDPHAAITAASAIIEALCKTYIETHGLEMPTTQTIIPLWKATQNALGLNPDRLLGDDQKQILSGLTSIINGIGSLRTHIGSAHGRGITPPSINSSDARLAINSAHTLVTFAMERWHSKQ